MKLTDYRLVSYMKLMAGYGSLAFVSHTKYCHVLNLKQHILKKENLLYDLNEVEIPFKFLICGKLTLKLS